MSQQVDRSIRSTFEAKFFSQVMQNPKPLRLTGEISVLLFVQIQFIYLRLYEKLAMGMMPLPTIIFSLYKLSSALYYLLFYRRDNKELALKQIGPLVNWSILLLCNLLLVAKFYFNKMYWTFINLPMIPGIAIKLLFVNLYWAELASIKNCMMNISVYCVAILNILVTLKLDAFLELSWAFVFWPYYVTLVCLLMGSGAATILACTKGIMLTKRKATTEEFLLCLWYLFLLLGSAALSFTFFVSTLRYLSEENLNQYMQAFLLPAIYLPMLAILSCFLYVKFKNKVARHNTGAFAANTQAPPPNQSFIGLIKAKFAPLYLQRLPGSVYKRMGSGRRRGPLQTMVGQGTEPRSLEESIDNIKPSMETLKTMRHKVTGMCETCAERKPDAVLMECGHGCFCSQCASKLIITSTPCPVCDKAIGLILLIDPNNSISEFVKVIGSMSTP